MKFKKKELLELERNLELMQSVSHNKKDNKSDYNAFKLISGANFKKIHAIGKVIARDMAQMLDMSEYDEFVREATELQEEGKSLDALKIKYADVLKKHHDTNIVLDKMLEDTIDVDLEKISIEKVPINITGSFLNSIKDMLLY